VLSRSVSKRSPYVGVEFVKPNWGVTGMGKETCRAGLSVNALLVLGLNL